MSRRSKIQIQVLKLYKDFLRVSKDKPGVKDYIRSEFRKNAQIARKDTLHIEHLLRRGERQLELLKTKEVQGVGVFVDDEKKKTE
ncbi:hypothetical protein FSP39_022465 [Pinctada imbricata]|uniref:Complex 1 LYR protein domain-containing protein n=1 Tax=Pinctada imbricata TaxID=66713 RepID=A0AA88Y193_PINIB|nr:hypothetical protein FSP39_022465 [Pinctada imbricata]